MSTKTKFWIRVTVVAGILAWPAVESYRLWDTTQKLEQAQALERSVQVKLEATRAKHTEVAGTPANPATTDRK